MWGVIQGPQSDLADWTNWDAATPFFPISSSYLSARGLVPCHTAYCIYNPGSSSYSSPLSLPQPPPQSHHPLLHWYSRRLLTSLMWQTSRFSQCLIMSRAMISPTAVVLGKTLVPISFLMHSLLSLSRTLSGTVTVQHNCRDKSYVCLQIFFLWGLRLTGNLEDL